MGTSTTGRLISESEIWWEFPFNAFMAYDLVLDGMGVDSKVVNFTNLIGFGVVGIGLITGRVGVVLNIILKRWLPL